MKFNGTIYLDNNATTPVDPAVLDAMMPFFLEFPGNAASRNHALGRKSQIAIDIARQKVAKLIGSRSDEVIFTSGATESINTAIKGVADRYQRKGKHIVTSVAEHPAVLDTCDDLRKRGFEITYLETDQNGSLDLGQLDDVIREDTILVALMSANNETGVMHPIDQIGLICQKHHTLFFCDATQTVGKVNIDLNDLSIDLMAFSAHKFYGPKGVGGLYLSGRHRSLISPLLHGGGHESDLRSGTPNVPGIVGMGAAAEICFNRMHDDSTKLKALRDHLEAAFLKKLPATQINAGCAQRLTHVANVRFDYVDGEALMSEIGKAVAVSSGSACTSSDSTPSHVLMSMGLTEREAKSSIRFSLGRFTDASEIEEVIKLVADGVDKLRNQNPVWELYKSGML